MILSDIAEIQSNFTDASFWLVNYTNAKLVGKPTSQYRREFIGVKAKNKNDAFYLFHMVMCFYKAGRFRSVMRGESGYVSLCLQSIQNLGVMRLSSDQRKIVKGILTQVSSLQNAISKELTDLLEEEGQLCERAEVPIDTYLNHFFSIGAKYTKIVDELKHYTKKQA